MCMHNCVHCTEVKRSSERGLDERGGAVREGGMRGGGGGAGRGTWQLQGEFGRGREGLGEEVLPDETESIITLTISNVN